LKLDFSLKPKFHLKTNLFPKALPALLRFKKLNFKLRKSELPKIIRAVSGEKQIYKR